MDSVNIPGLALNESQAQALVEARCEDPFALLGPHAVDGGVALRVYLPGAERVHALVASGTVSEIALTPAQVPGLFIGLLPCLMPYQLRVVWPQATQLTPDPYAFGRLLDEADLRQFGAGLHPHLSAHLGARPLQIEGVDGVRFSVWAPNARRVSVVGDFNAWDGRRHPMRRRVEAGVWELFVPGLGTGTLYKFEILGPNGVLPLKADPVALQMEASPGTASVVADPTPFTWTDQHWLAQRSRAKSASAPLSIYEVHAQSWRRPVGQTPGWDELAETLIDYVAALGFTHIELLPVSAHPFGGSWGYQPLGMYAPHPALGSPTQLKAFIDRCHARGVGVIVDWVPAHFPTDAHGLAHFDGTALYEHADPREGFQHDWNTLIYNLGRNEVCAHLIGSALHWLDEYHVDGLRVDAVASMLYRDYSRRAGEWIPNRCGGRENFEAIAFLQRFNEAVNTRHPGVLTIAEESTAWPGVTTAVERGGLGFSYKWNMGWMHDSLRYLSTDPVFRAHRHHDITFGLSYAFSERYVLPLSHDEVVHGKRSLLGRMPGDPWQQHAHLRAYLAFMWSHPGKKMLFMGGEIAQTAEWNHDGQLDWEALEQATTGASWKRGVRTLVADLNHRYRSERALHAGDSEADGFFWIVGDDAQQSVFIFGRRDPSDPDQTVVVVCNFTPVPRPAYRFGVPGEGSWRLLLNTDAQAYGGSGYATPAQLEAQHQPSHGLRYSVSLSLPPLATVLLRSEAKRQRD